MSIYRKHTVRESRVGEKRSFGSKQQNKARGCLRGKWGAEAWASSRAPVASCRWERTGSPRLHRRSSFFNHVAIKEARALEAQHPQEDPTGSDTAHTYTMCSHRHKMQQQTWVQERRQSNRYATTSKQDCGSQLQIWFFPIFFSLLHK